MQIKDCKSLLESSDFWTLTALWMHFWLLAPGFIRNQWQEKYTVCSHSKASRFPFCNFGAIWQQLTTFGNPIIYQDHKMNAILGFCWRNIIINHPFFFTDTKIEDNSRAFKLQKANFDSEVNTAVRAQKLFCTEFQLCSNVCLCRKRKLN